MKGREQGVGGGGDGEVGGKVDTVDVGTGSVRFGWRHRIVV